MAAFHKKSRPERDQIYLIVPASISPRGRRCRARVRPRNRLLNVARRASGVGCGQQLWEMPVNDLVGCRDMELLCRRRAVVDSQHSGKWLGEAERWRDLAHRETAARFQTMGPGPMAMGPYTIEGDYRN